MNGLWKAIRAVREKGFFSLLTANMLTQLLGFATVLLVAKFVGPEQLGDLRILQSYIAVFIILGGFGYNTAILKHCAAPIDAQEKGELLALGLKRSLTASVAVLAVVAVLGFSGVVTRSQTLGYWLALYAVLIPFTVLTQLLTSFVQALKRIRELARIQTLIKAQSFVLIVVCSWRWEFPGFVISTIVASAIGMLLVVPYVSWEPRATKSENVPYGFTRMAVLSMLGNGVLCFREAGQFFILDRFVSDRETIGYFSLATIFVLGARQVTATVQSIVTPYFSARCTDRQWFRRCVVKTQIHMAGLSPIVAICVYVGAWILVSTVYGADYESVLVYLPVLLLKYVFLSSYAVVAVALLSLGMVHFNLAVAVAVTTLGLGLSYAFLDCFGLIGVAWAQVIADLFGLLLTLGLSRLAFRQAFGKTLANPQPTTSASTRVVGYRR